MLAVQGRLGVEPQCKSFLKPVRMQWMIVMIREQLPTDDRNISSSSHDVTDAQDMPAFLRLPGTVDTRHSP